MSVSQNFPNIFPSMSMDFANVQALDPRITFARASTATYYGTRTALAEQNLLLQSQTFDSGSWSKSNTTVTADATTAPDGTATAELVYPTTTGNGRFIFQSLTLASATYTQSIFAKASGLNHLCIYTAGGASGAAWFNLSTGAVGTVAGGFTATITSVGNSWYRCTVTFTASSSFGLIVGGVDADNTITATTSGTNGVFLWGAQLEQRSSVTAYTVTTTQPITNYVPVLETAASGVARFDHNPTTFESLGLEIEEQRTNLVLYSADYSNAVWGVNNLTVSSNVNIAPDSTQTADALVESTGSVSPAIYFTTGISLTSGTAYTGSVYLKANGRNFVAVYFQSANFPDSGRIAWFDLSTQTTQFQSGVTGTITSVGNGWYRCTITATADATGNTSTNSLGVLIAPALGSTAAYTGNGFSGLFIWGAQFETGAFPTSYIPTVASQVTRAADSASMTGTNLTSWYRDDQGSFYAEVGSKIYANSRVISLTNAAGSRLIDIYSNSGNDLENFTQSTGGGTTVITNSVANSPFKVALAYKVNDWSTAANGVQGGTSATTLVTIIPTTISIGAFSSARTNGTIKKIAYYPLRLSNTNLQALTG